MSFSVIIQITQIVRGFEIIAIMFSGKVQHQDIL